MEKPDESEIKNITIKLPSDLQERILCFPFLHAISEYYPKAVLHFITPKHEVEVLNLLPFKAYYHLYSEDEIQNVFDVHRFCANASIYNVDLFISLTNSFVDACLGLGLRAKKRVGFADNWKTLVLNQTMLRPVGHHVVEDFMKLFELAVGEPADKRLRVHTRDLLPIINKSDVEKEEVPYIAINLSPLRNATIEDEWIELISHFEGQKIVLFASEETVKVQMLMDALMARLSPKNTYVNFVYHDWIELGRMMAFSAGVITYSGAAGALAAYVGTRSIILYENENPQRTGPFYFLTDVAVMGVNNPTLVNSTADTGILKERKTFDMLQVFTKASEFFKI
ncbi:MAG: glycosyltransferase family 9 protein [Bacteriovoracaceae bacterium]|nr:glycosyltransferase family 9 protein [Bacteriovoracaceae bacterium]